MHDGSDDISRVSSTHEAVVGAVNCLISERYDYAAATQILASLLKMTEHTSANFTAWIWGTTIKFLSKQNSFGEPRFDQHVENLLRRLVCQIVQMLSGFESNSQDAQLLACAGKLVQLYLVFLKILAKNLKSLAVVQVRDGVAKIYPLVNDEMKSKLTAIISSLPAAQSETLSNAFSSWSMAYVGLHQDSYSKVFNCGTGESLPPLLILEQLPSHFLNLCKVDLKICYGQLVRMFLSCKASTLRQALSDCLVRITLSSTDSFSDLFSKNLAEQIGVASYFPFSSKPGSEVHVKSLVPSLLTLWRRLVEGQDQLVVMVLDACSNLFREGVFPSIHLNEIIELLKLSLKLCPDSAVKLIRHIVPYCSFKVALDLLDLYKSLEPLDCCAFETWKLIAALSTAKFPDTFHRRLSETVVPYLAKTCTKDRSWLMKHVMLTSLEVYARYSTCLDIFEHPFIAQYQSELLGFYQRQNLDQFSPKFDSLQLGNVLMEYQLSQLSVKDHIVEQLKQLQTALSSCPDSSKYRYRIEELLYLCTCAQ